MTLRQTPLKDTQSIWLSPPPPQPLAATWRLTPMHRVGLPSSLFVRRYSHRGLLPYDFPPLYLTVRVTATHLCRTVGKMLFVVIV